MTTINRQLISVLLSLLLMISGPALAISKIGNGQTDPRMADCGPMMVDQADNTSSTSSIKADCISIADIACMNATGLSQCGINAGFALLLRNSLDLTNTGSQPVLNAHPALYQAPFLASITPPPEYHS